MNAGYLGAAYNPFEVVGNPAEANARVRGISLPDELKAAFDRDLDLAAAFDSLTPGRQRGYVLHISAAKQAETQITRIASARNRIMTGKGRNDR